ncbi:hypothetical protein [Sphaerisporangium perillae]|uniref:hypothetical protein n=1 Tax=Sphaerisporangium perillae TaxID=2935860 RepID=UPI00200C060A|nr:hypothetical protein [Sphaerisporangium perillae]
MRVRAPAPKLMAALVGGRAAFRGTTLLVNIALLAAWGSAGYSEYAQAMGAATFLTPLASIGIEKCALKLIPRVRHTGPLLVGIYVALAGALLLVALAVLAAVLFFRQDGPGPPAALAGLYAIFLGGNQVLVGLCRAVGRPGRDVANHLVLAAALACWTGVAVLYAAPMVFLALCVATLAVLNAVLLAGLRPRFGGLRRRTLVRAAVGTSLLMAVPDVVGGLSTSLLFLALSVSGADAESSGLYMAFVASSTFLNAFGYLLRIVQPDVSRALHQRDLTGVHDRLARWLRLLMLTGTPYLLVVLGAALLSLRPLGGVGVVILYAACVPIIFAMGSANYLMENATPEALAATATGAAISLVAVGALAFLVVPWAGALGAVAVLAAGELVHAAAVLRWLGPRRALSHQPIPGV